MRCYDKFVIFVDPCEKTNAPFFVTCTGRDRDTLTFVDVLAIIELYVW